jgi:hypothetical protein
VEASDSLPGRAARTGTTDGGQAELGTFYRYLLARVFHGPAHVRA